MPFGSAEGHYPLARVTLILMDTLDETLPWIKPRLHAGTLRHRVSPDVEIRAGVPEGIQAGVQIPDEEIAAFFVAGWAGDGA